MPVNRLANSIRWAALLTLAGLGLPAVAAAFHDGGVGSCRGCHIMHASEDGVSDDPFGLPMLLRFGNSTDLCLSCHAEAQGAVLWPDPLAPPPELGAGNFTFLFEDNINDAGDGAQNPIAGHRAGHSVVAPGWGLDPDPDFPVAPGGNYPSGELTCTSCHDPHGNSEYRLLRGAGPAGPGGYVFLFAAPQADGIGLNEGPEGPLNHSAYRSGWSAWCANCHGDYLDEHGGQGWEHPADEALEGEQIADYNAYAGPGNPPGDPATAYLPEVALEDLAADTGSSMGATAISRISCLTCHRAHASSAPASLRWDPNVRFLAEDGVVSGSYPLPDPFAHPQQRALCVKCHLEQTSGHGFGRACMDCHRQDSP